jgi:hypothetical protein
MLFLGLDKNLDLEKRMKLDLENVGNVITELSESRTSWNLATTNSPSNLSQFGIHFVKNISSSSYSYIFEVGDSTLSPLTL